ncbi:aminopeptidase N [Limibaculum sp. M0105]|uniref:Aminopeptidase N n=1 Tax=Thermohalobaculum xanthum TaxID=2753746 RepID=A0A8J7SC55_9RHOB|nr:aminopeptidase N [Thermohalobaculum xanthum]MBK0398041.1 aminopeptidase N [Thermohalobaculum xanthum]
MRTDTATGADRKIRLADYRPPAWMIEQVRLDFDLAPRATRVRARIAFRRNSQAEGARPDLRLDGRRLTFVGASIDGAPLDQQALSFDAEGLTVPAAALPGDSFTWECETEIDPETNTELEGLYLSRNMFCTQCEAEGFRKITYYPDRPDVMAPFTVRIEAAAADYPVLLSNGNPGATGGLPGGRHFAEWHDPHPKPAYLFALVAGELVAHEDRFTTASGREVELRVWVRPGDEDKCAYAMDALKRSMRWDETAYGREYDLDVFQIVAVDDFNMGAMENKGLNIFNSKYVLASPETATDADYERIESIVAHEYFHNWTGNRITCRDWFQLCLKEGLTVFRDQCFTGDERSEPVKRIDDVKLLRARQFREDQGPLAHPVRPEEYIEINNFYTATVYEKGAEVIRMLRTLVGEDGYRKALDLYFERHDGEACTIEQFRQCFEDATGRDLSDFARWWSQAGTPRLSMSEDWDGGTYTLTLRQQTPPTPGQDSKAPLVIPVATGLIGPDGAELVPTRVLELREAEQAFRFEGLPARPVASVLRGFSAPVTLERQLDDATRAFLLAHDIDPFNRWQAGRDYAVAIALRLIAGGTIPNAWAEALGRLLADDSLDPAFRALALELPGEDEMAGEVVTRGGLADPDAIHEALRAMRAHLGGALGEALATLRARMAVTGPYSPDAGAAGRRALANRCLALMLAADTPEAHRAAEAQFDAADNMTDRIAALAVLVHADAPGATPRLDAFLKAWEHDPLVLDKWLTVQATAPLKDAAARVEALTGHSAFEWKNPNRFRALIGSFAVGNAVGFHAADGAGYRLVADWLLRLDPVNPQTTARVAGCFETWRRYEPGRQALMRAELERIAAAPALSRNTREIVERILG